MFIIIIIIIAIIIINIQIDLKVVQSEKIIKKLNKSNKYK